MNLFQRTEQRFDKLFNYNRQQTESFDFYNTMKNSSSTDKLQMQEQEIKAAKISYTDGNKKIVDVQMDENVKVQINTSLKAFSETLIQQQICTSVNQSIHQQTSGFSSLFSILPPAADNNRIDEQQLMKPKKKKKWRPRLS